MNTSFKFIFFCLASAVIPAANAAVATNTFQVQLVITSSCSVAQPAALNMGSVASYHNGQRLNEYGRHLFQNHALLCGSDAVFC